MKRIIQVLTYTLLATVLISTVSLQSCKKDKPKPQEEANLVVNIDPVPSNPVRTLGATYDFKVVVESKMPPQGVDVSITYRKDSDNTVVFSQSYTTSATPLNVTVTGIPFNEMGTVTVVVTSKSKATNTVTKTFKLVRK